MTNFTKLERKLIEGLIERQIDYLSAYAIGMLVTGYDVSPLQLQVYADGTVTGNVQPINRHPVHYEDCYKWEIEQRVSFDDAVAIAEFVARLQQEDGYLFGGAYLPDLCRCVVPEPYDLDEVNRVRRAVSTYRVEVFRAFFTGDVVTADQLYAIVSPVPREG